MAAVCRPYRNVGQSVLQWLPPDWNDRRPLVNALHRRRFLTWTASLLALPPISGLAQAQAYPSRPVRIIVPFAPGGQTDVVARLIALKLSDKLGRQFYVENVAGAGGNIGMGRAAQAAPDGYTLVFIDSIGYAANPSLYSKVPYDPVADFDAVGIGATTMQVLAVNPSVPAKTVQELVALIRSDPGKYSYSSAGVGTGAHLTGELFKAALKLDLLHVPYGGGGPAIAASVAGHTPISFGSAAATIPQHQDGKLRALAVGGKTRLKGLPSVPTFSEAGYAVECDAIVGLLAPAKTPKDIVALINREMAAIVAQPEVRDRLTTLGFEVSSPSPEEFGAFLKAELPKWANVIRTAGIKTQQ
jgi:tripartite-type tricarboxylate transporter receptor subunit TctC